MDTILLPNVAEAHSLTQMEALSPFSFPVENPSLSFVVTV